MPRRGERNFQYLPSAGVRIDLKRLMNAFLACNTVRYEQFCQVWRDRKMSYLCAGRQTDREAREFVERVFMIAQEYFLPPYQFQVRVGGLYALYAIYQIQPLNPKVKIRMTPMQWQDTMNFQQQAAQQNHLDVVYVFQRLLHEQAFLFCCTPAEMSIYSCMKELEDKEEDMADSLKEEKSVLNTLFNYESLEKLSYLQDQYQQKKVQLSGPDAQKPVKSLDVVQGDLVEDIIVLLQGFKETVATINKQGKRTEDADQGTESKVETTGSRRHKLKSQAFSNVPVQTNKLHIIATSSNSPVKSAAASREYKREKTKSPARAITESSTCAQRKLDHDDDDDDDDDDDSDDSDYSPTKKSSKKTDKRKERRRRNDEETKAVEQVSSSSRAGDLEMMCEDTMPVLDDTDHRSASPGKTLQTKSGPRRRFQTKSASEALLSARCSVAPDRADVTYKNKSANEIMVYPINPVVFSGKENPVHTAGSRNKIGDTGRPRNKPHDEDDDEDMSGAVLTNKIAFKWKRRNKKEADSDKKGADNSDKKGTDDSDVQVVPTEPARPAPRKRGRPRKYPDDTEIRVYPNITTVPTDNNKYEMVILPAGTASDYYKCGQDHPTPQTGQKMMGTDWTIGDDSDAGKIICALENLGKNRGHRHRTPCQETITEVVVTKEVGKPVAVKSVTTQVTGTSQAVAPKADDAGTSQAIAPRAENASHMKNGSPVSMSVAIQRLKDRCKRKMKDVDEPVNMFIKRCQEQDGQNLHPVLEQQEEDFDYLGPLDSDNEAHEGKDEPHNPIARSKSPIKKKIKWHLPHPPAHVNSEKLGSPGLLRPSGKQTEEENVRTRCAQQGKNVTLEPWKSKYSHVSPATDVPKTKKFMPKRGLNVADKPAAVIVKHEPTAVKVTTDKLTPVKATTDNPTPVKPMTDKPTAGLDMASYKFI